MDDLESKIKDLFQSASRVFINPSEDASIPRGIYVAGNSSVNEIIEHLKNNSNFNNVQIVTTPPPEKERSLWYVIETDYIFKVNQKNNEPPHTKVCGLIGPCFLDDRSVDHILKDVVLGRHYRH